MASNPIAMWLGSLVLYAIVTFYIVIQGVDALVFPSRMNATRIFLLCYGIINAIFYFFAMVMVCEPPEYDYSYAERVERYRKVIAPMIVLFPLLLPLWGCMLITTLAYRTVELTVSVYKRLETKMLGEDKKC
jgi:hypothetical protein